MTTFESFAMWFMRSMCARHVRKCISKNRKVNIKIEWNAYPSDAKNRFRLMNCLNMERLVLALGLTFIILFLCFALLCLRSRHRRCSFVHLFVFCVYVTRDFHPYIRRSIVNTLARSTLLNALCRSTWVTVTCANACSCVGARCALSMMLHFGRIAFFKAHGIEIAPVFVLRKERTYRDGHDFVSVLKMRITSFTTITLIVATATAVESSLSLLKSEF